MKTLIMIPLQKESDAFLEGFPGETIERATLGRLAVTRLPELGLVVAEGGLGKVQFALQTQHLLDVGPGWDWVICAGAAGGLVDAVAVGDIVVGTETVEHDINNKMGPPRLPKYPAAPNLIEQLQRPASVATGFQVHFGPIASGDEDVVDTTRRAEVVQQTGGLAVAWEGAGGARACQFSQIPFIEIRGITDAANSTAPDDFRANLPMAMRNVAVLLSTWCRET